MIACLVILPLGCEGSREQLEARAFLDEYLAALQNDRLNDALAMCAPEFFETTSREEWLGKLEMSRQTLGRIQSFTANKWTMEMLSNGVFVTFEAEVTYLPEAAGAAEDQQTQTTEVITLVKPVKQERFMVFGHHIRSEKILEEDR